MCSGSLIQLSLSFSFVKLAQSWETTEETDKAREVNPSPLPLVSPRAATVIGYLPQEILGTSCYEYFHQDDLQQLAEKHRQGDGAEQPRSTTLTLFKGPVCWIKPGGRNWIKVVGFFRPRYTLLKLPSVLIPTSHRQMIFIWSVMSLTSWMRKKQFRNHFIPLQVSWALNLKLAGLVRNPCIFIAGKSSFFDTTEQLS